MVLKYKDAEYSKDENFIFPNIDEVHVNANGKPNIIHSDGLRREGMYKEEKKFFTTTQEISGLRFFKDCFAFVLDFRSCNDNSVYNYGTRVTGDYGMQVIRFRKQATTKDVKC